MHLFVFKWRMTNSIYLYSSGVKQYSHLGFPEQTKNKHICTVQNHSLTKTDKKILIKQNSFARC